MRSVLVAVLVAFALWDGACRTYPFATPKPLFPRSRAWPKTQAVPEPGERGTSKIHLAQKMRVISNS